jgi:hypothetical protein
MCRFDLAVEIGNLAPGDYEIWFYIYDVRLDPEPELRTVIPVSVDGENPTSGGLALVSCSNSGCLGGTSEETDPGTPPSMSWTMVKVYYR